MTLFAPGRDLVLPGARGARGRFSGVEEYSDRQVSVRKFLSFLHDFSRLVDLGTRPFTQATTSLFLKMTFQKGFNDHVGP